MAHHPNHRAVREKVQVLISDSLLTIAETIVDLEDQIDALESEIEDLRKQVGGVS